MINSFVSYSLTRPLLKAFCFVTMKAKLKLKMIKISELFPNVLSSFIFCSYMLFCIGQGILVTASRKEKDGYGYNIVTVVLLTEIMKLILASICFFKDDTVSSLFKCIRSNLKVLCLYLVPSFLYCIYNNLAFINLSHFDPTSYFILLQLRVVITGVIFQIVFHKKLSQTQWLSLLLLTFGCMIQQTDWNYLTNLFTKTSSKEKDYFTLLLHLFLILIQALCSCFAGVYTEYLLKNVGINVNLFIQNIFMYIDSIFWNVIILVIQGNFMNTFSKESLSPILKPLVIFLIINNSLVGIITSIFLKNLNSILKTFASAMELLFTAALSWIIFGIPVKLNTILAIFIVSYSIFIYSQNPVNNKQLQTVKDQENLLEEN